MSHVATIEIDIKDINALDRAAKRLGMTLVQGQQTYKWYGRSVGDYPLPQGFKAEDLGKCEHALVVDGADKQTYEVGVVRRRDGRPGFVLQWDFFAKGYGLEARVGKDCQKLRQAYALEVAKMQAQRKGFRVTEQMQADGSVDLIAVKA